MPKKAETVTRKWHERKVKQLQETADEKDEARVKMWERVNALTEELEKTIKRAVKADAAAIIARAYKLYRQ